MAKKYILKEPVSAPGFRIDYEHELNPSQLAVVRGAEGPSLVLAGAGSGKTRTLVYRVLYLIESGVPAENILLVTFTNKAAFEMRSRVERVLGRNTGTLWCGTFHHIGHRTLRMSAARAGLSENFGILDEEDSRDLLKTCYEVLPFKPQEANFPKANVVQKILSFSTNVCQDLAAVLAERYPYFVHFEGEFRRLRAEYDKRKAKSRNLDYDDLLVRWIRLLEEDESVRERFTAQFRYCLVDEFQDTNPLQSRVVQILASRHRNLLVVGDDAQSIYSFRGADIRNILNFPKVYSDTRTTRLETNYRSTPQILALANDSIRHNRRQFPKELKSVREDSLQPELVRVRDVPEQSAFVAQRILEYAEEGVPLREIAVLFRSRYLSAELELELSKRRVPYVLRGGVRFFEQAHIKDVLSYLKILVNPQDELSWIRALRQYPGIGEATAGKAYQAFVEAGGSLAAVVRPEFGKKLPQRIEGGLARFKTLLKGLLDPSLAEHPDVLIDKVLEAGYAAYARAHFENAADRIEDLKELVNFAHTYKNLEAFLADVSLREGFKGESLAGEDPDEDPEHLVLSTIHQAKGLEWKVVFIIGLSEGHFPHHLASDSDEAIEEERRLFYVAATRAKDALILVHPMTRFEYHLGSVLSRPSLFLTELSPDVYEKVEIERSDEMDEEIISLDE